MAVASQSAPSRVWNSKATPASPTEHCLRRRAGRDGAPIRRRRPAAARAPTTTATSTRNRCRSNRQRRTTPRQNPAAEAVSRWASSSRGLVRAGTPRRSIDSGMSRQYPPLARLDDVQLRVRRRAPAVSDDDHVEPPDPESTADPIAPGGQRCHGRRVRSATGRRRRDARPRPSPTKHATAATRRAGESSGTACSGPAAATCRGSTARTSITRLPHAERRHRDEAGITPARRWRSKRTSTSASIETEPSRSVSTALSGDANPCAFAP